MANGGYLSSHFTANKSSEATNPSGGGFRLLAFPPVERPVVFHNQLGEALALDCQILRQPSEI